nr:hypothetical protein [Tanacetum cinerariifolium]GEY05035.1 hypothetical protein [Tanacetum cinerariifolium]
MEMEEEYDNEGEKVNEMEEEDEDRCGEKVNESQSYVEIREITFAIFAGTNKLGRLKYTTVIHNRCYTDDESFNTDMKQQVHLLQLQAAALV